MKSSDYYLGCFLATCLSSWMISETMAAGYMDQNAYSTQGQVQKVRRERHLDHLDSDTLAYYLDEYPGFDTAVLFYAQWDSHSRTLAPYWAKIAENMDAGTSTSNLVMALFDCELNVAHSELCQAAGITHYPTMMFIGSGPYHDSNPFSNVLGKPSKRTYGTYPVPNAVMFPGAWQYTDSISDWIVTMQALSKWHIWTTQGFGRRLRNLFIPQRSKQSELPVGVPGRAAPPTSASSGADSSLKVQSLEEQLEQYQDITGQLEKMATRSSNFLDTVLVGNSGGGDGNSDMFTMLHEEQAWAKSTRPKAEILRNCVAELSLDYCQRLSQAKANTLVDDLMSQGMAVDEIIATENLEQLILDRIGEIEPYCLLLDNCVITDFAGEECQPQECPFRNQSACQYLTSCLNPALQEEYAEALGLQMEEPEPQQEEQSKKKKKTWGF